MSNRYRSGFTLLEVMVALAILAMAITNLVVIRNESIQQASESKDVRRLKMLAEQKIGEITAEIDKDKKTKGNFSGEYENYTWEVKNEPFTLQSQPNLSGKTYSVNLRKIHLTVQHQVSNTETRSYVAEVYLLEGKSQNDTEEPTNNSSEDNSSSE